MIFRTSNRPKIKRCLKAMKKYGKGSQEYVVAYNAVRARAFVDLEKVS